MTEACKCCGHPLAPKDAVNVLTPLQQRIFTCVRRAGTNGIASRDVFDIVYQDDANGGPENMNIISVVANQANRRLAPFGLKITGKRGPGGRLTLQRVPS